MAEKQSIVANVKPEDFFKVVTDYAKYHEFVTGVTASEIKRREGDKVDLYMELDLIKTFKYTIRMKEEPPFKVSWTLLDGDFFKKNSGSWTLEPVEGGKKTRATYSNELEFNLFVPKMILNKLTAVSLPQNLKDFKQRAESLFEK